MLTVLVEQQNQVLPAVRAHVEEQSGTLAGPEAQGDVLCSQGRVRQGAAAPVRLLEGVADGCSRLEAG